MRGRDFTQFEGDPECLRWAVWDLKNLDNALKYVSGHKVAVQAGGNLGVFASVLAQTFDTVHTFEPNPDHYALLRKNVPASNVIAHKAGLGAEVGLSGISKPDGGHDGEYFLTGAGDAQVVTLDSLALDACDLLYLDIEGFELFALQGAVETIKRFKPVIALEINKCCGRYGYGPEEIAALMKDLGYVERAHVHNDHIFVPDETLNLVCVRVGDKYGPEYVRTLFDMLLRNLSTHEGKIALWCITDDPESLPEGVNPIQPGPHLPGWWQKIRLFAPHMPWGEGEPVVYFDLDVAITGRLEDLVMTPGIIKDWHWPCYNSSVMSWRHGEHREIWSEFDWSSMDQPGQLISADVLPEGQVNGGDQEWITQISQWETFPAEWCKSYRESKSWPPSDCRVVVFHGEPKPADCGGWVADTWKVGGFTSLPEMKGVNVEREAILENVKASSKLDLPWFTPWHTHTQTMVLVCGGPSLKDHLKEIRDHKRRGAKIVTVNNCLTYLLSEGIVPDRHVMLDARRENAEFVRSAPLGVRYLIASQAHPDVFEALKDREVVVWHNASDSSEIEPIVSPHERPDRPAFYVPGGCTVGLRAMFLGFLSGFRKLHIYGMDGSYEGGKHHAYAQTLNDGESMLKLVMGGRHYVCAPWMARQANDFEGHWKWLTENGMSIHVHGRGLIPDMAKALKAQLRAKAA